MRFQTNRNSVRTQDVGVTFDFTSRHVSIVARNPEGDQIGRFDMSIAEAREQAQLLLDFAAMAEYAEARAAAVSK